MKGSRLVWDSLDHVHGLAACARPHLTTISIPHHCPCGRTLRDISGVHMGIWGSWQGSAGGHAGRGGGSEAKCQGGSLGALQIRLYAQVHGRVGCAECVGNLSPWGGLLPGLPRPARCTPTAAATSQALRRV